MLHAHEVVVLDELAQGLRPSAGDGDRFEGLSEDVQRETRSGVKATR